MSNNQSNASDSSILTLPYTRWGQDNAQNSSAVEALEQGKVLFLPHLAFELSEQEMQLLDPALVDVKRKNISFKPLEGTLTGVTDESKVTLTRQLLERYYQNCLSLVNQLLPDYISALHSPTNSLRLHPVTAWRDKTSWRKDDSRLHVDAFPSRPNYGERIIRIFTNINPHNEPRSWRIGEDFSQLASRYLPQLDSYSPVSSWLQHKIGITKRRRSHYDHLMLQLHDKMKSDSDYQKNGLQQAIDFPAGCSWICFSDQTPHAAMGGQFMLEQTFLLPVEGMKNPQQSPLKILESLTQKSLI
ncbi:MULTISPECIES: Kdo hydroxylase family protein [Yersinia]|uniref:Kdo hydroxylase family protein n=1 Tax=Yersinia TaxID=629 RepID=UPI0016439752|nr:MULTISPECIES: Kdo hydroxylase family protein [Yersinia]MDA5542695.1 Kdo hydroxylase family protein [Yersinia rochesterensis]MDN0105772.1 Kdo hydroxylase family protein [Yersinia rochesterensis]UZM76563.1 Kdo hydroxylase family protein [Yersinia sp. SCPM-O-B-9106 (C-191)]